ncbi:MAG: dUTP diphosphatase [Candidatus Thorarchaeota archaeon]|nr:dUTP diphosphatase [Candidatus Thorarchaeota archaeon]
MNESSITVKVKKLNPDATVPQQAKSGDAAYDLYSIDDYLLASQSRLAIHTGIAIEIPTGYEGQVRPRSGLALKQGITVVNSPGTIDCGYRGEVVVILHNLGEGGFYIKKGMRIAQLAIRPVPEVRFELVDELGGSDRGEGGFGSTGT